MRDVVGASARARRTAGSNPALVFVVIFFDFDPGSHAAFCSHPPGEQFQSSYPASPRAQVRPL